MGSLKILRQFGFRWMSAKINTELISSNLPATSLDKPALAQIIAILAQIFSDESCAVYLFGSRATHRATATSDFDLAVLAAQDVSYKLSLAREKLEQSNIPFKIELVDLRVTSAAFSRQVQTEGVLLWKN